MVFSKNGLFEKSESKNLYHALYDIALHKILEHAHKFNKSCDYYQMRDNENNGWDFFYYGYANQMGVIKNAKVVMVVSGWQVGDKIEFSKEDTQKILDKIPLEPYDGAEMVIKVI